MLDLQPCDNDTAVVLELKRVIRKGIVKRMSIDENAKLTPDALENPRVLSILLDPRFKGSACKTVLGEHLELAKDKIETMIEQNENPAPAETKFPRVTKTAKKLLAIPSVPSERVFSIAGLTVTKLRSALDPETVDQLVFLNKNLKRKNRKSTVTSTETPGDIEIKEEEQDSATPVLAKAPRLPSMSDDIPLVALPTLDRPGTSKSTNIGITHEKK